MVRGMDPLVEERGLRAYAKEIIDELCKHVTDDVDKGARILGSPSERYSREMLDLLARLNVTSIGPRELEQFAFDVDVEVKDKRVVVTTDELDIAAFLKVLFLRGASIKIYSAHDFPNTGLGR